MSIVLRLQKKCLDNNEDLQNLLREALVISKKLKLKDFEQWIKQELQGYSSIEEVPEYRKIRQTLQFFNLYHGWQDAELTSQLSEVIGIAPIIQSISEIEYVISKSENGLYIPVPENIAKTLRELYKVDRQSRFLIDATPVYGILGQVRNLLLEWTLKLEEDNILGNDDLIFSEDEKKAAQHIYNIGTFHGVMGNVDNVGNMSTGANATNIYNENSISNKIDELIVEIKKLGLTDQKEVIRDLEASKDNPEKAKAVLGGLLTRGSEVASIGSAIIGILGLL
ncbi:hypothetical protein [Sulfuricurvum sp.]|uniref:AbiTii domain-containing protein n=1 Tax=Sulfuricurvum sp. TaxID=2025608 RepID=UPI003C5ECAAB